LAAAAVFLLLALSSTSAVAGTDDGHRLVGLLDYIGADYSAAIEDGQVINDFEYREMHTLSDDARSLAKGAETTPAALTQTLEELDALIAEKASPEEVGETARQARRIVVEHFDVSLSPTQAPSLERGRKLYAANCTVCHGTDGAADVPGAADMEPTPTDFTEADTRAVLSPYRAFNTVTYGVEGTPMRAFTELSAAERWDVAFYVMSLAHGGEATATTDELPEGFSADLETLASLSNQDLREKLVTAGAADDRADELVASLRVDAPAQFDAAKGRPLAVAFEHLDAGKAALDDGDFAQARKEVLSAYLDGFEPVESRLAAVDRGAVVEAEDHFMRLRDALESRKEQAAVAEFSALRSSLDQAEQLLGDQSAQSWTAGVASAVIILREGLEIVLLIGLLLGLLRRFGVREARKYVHAGWMTAFVAGGLTWFAANELIAISGAGRELIEGVVGLLAAAVLFSVSYWFLSNIHGQKWLDFIKEKVAEKASGGHMWTLFGLAFLAVYREAFETILFYQALLIEAQGSEGSVIAGMAAGAAILAVVAFVILKAGKKLPLKPFFAISGALLYALCVVLVGSGLHAFVEAGYLPVKSLPLPTISWLGFYPEVITVVAQGLLVVAAVVWGGFVFRKPAE
jgi:high-affinity iron transporter